jgi:hypothetical protein
MFPLRYRTPTPFRFQTLPMSVGYQSNGFVELVIA